MAAANGSKPTVNLSEFQWYWMSGLAVVVVIMLLPKPPGGLLVRLGMTIAFFGGTITFLSAFLAPYRQHLATKVERQYKEGGPALLHTAKLAADATASCAALLTWPLLALMSITALRVLAYWPQFGILQGLAPLLAMLWWLALGGFAAAIAFNTRKLKDLAQKRALLRQQVATLGYKPLEDADHAARDAQLTEPPVQLLGERTFRAGGFDWNWSDFQKNCVVFGQSGSGKTVCVLNAIVDGLLGSEPRCSGLILDPKGDYRRKIEGLCQRNGRGADLLILDPSDATRSIRWNPFDSDDDELELASRFAAAMQTLGMKNEQDSYWIDSARTFIRHAIGLLRNTDEQMQPPSFANIMRLASTSVAGDGAGIAPGSFAEERIARVNGDDDSGVLAVDYFIDNWAKLAERTRSVVQSQIVNMIDPFLMKPYRELFSGRSTMGLSDVVDQGKILYVYMPIADKEAMAKTVCTLLKLEFFREVLKRPDKTRPSFFLCDEFQSFFTVGGGKGDADFFERSRQSLHANVIATQNLPALLKQAGNTPVAVENLLGHCAVKIFLRNTDQKTNEFASKLFGQHIEQLVNTSESQSGSALASQIGTGSSTSAQYSAKVKEEMFVELAQPSATDAINYAATIVHLGSRAAVSEQRLRWRVHPL
jgi:type IV secretory pathway TraG/TraD family ATPase VirD4